MGTTPRTVPARTPRALVDRLNAVTNRALPELKERYAAIGTEIAGGSAMEFAAYIKSELVKWTRVIKEAGIKAE